MMYSEIEEGSIYSSDLTSIILSSSGSIVVIFFALQMKLCNEITTIKITATAPTLIFTAAVTDCKG